jgi:hypothetical protein
MRACQVYCEAVFSDENGTGKSLSPFEYEAHRNRK